MSKRTFIFYEFSNILKTRFLEDGFWVLSGRMRFLIGFWRMGLDRSGFKAASVGSSPQGRFDARSSAQFFLEKLEVLCEPF